MERTLGYIFGSLQVSEAAIGKIIKNLKKQKYFNKYTSLSLAMCGFGISCAAKHCLEHKKKIEELEKRIEGMEKELKGE